jgi:hypothetical protein
VTAERTRLPGRRVVLGPWVAIALSLSLALVYHAGTLEPGARPLLNLDDGYIHGRLAENLVGTAVLGLNPGDGGGGSSALLWTLLVGAGVAVGLPGALAAGLLSVLGLALAVGLASRLSFDLLPPAPAWIASIAVATGGQTVALGLSGMESLLFAGLVIAGVRDATLGRRGRGTLFLCLAAGVRTDALLAALAVCVVASVFSGREPGSPKPWPDWMRFAAVVAAAAAAVLGLAVLGQELPSTLEARRWLYGMGDSVLPGREQWTGVIPSLLGDLWIRLSGMQGPGHVVGHAWAALAAALAIAGCGDLCRQHARAHLPVYLFIQAAFVVLVLGSDGQLSRYLAPLWMLAPLIVARGWCAIGRRLGSLLTVPLLVFLLALYVPQAFRWSGWHRGAVEHLRDAHLEMALRVTETVPADEAVAAFDVGLLSYAGDGRLIVDMGGLTDPGMARAMRRAEVPEALAARGVRYAVFPETDHPGPRYLYATRLGFVPGRLGAPLARTTVRTDDLSYLNPTKVAMPALALYELRF